MTENELITANNEIQAIAKIAEILTPLDAGAKKRVLHWALEFFSVKGDKLPEKSDKAQETTNGLATDNNERFSTIAELFDGADPKMDSEKALVIAYWLQIYDSQESFSSQSVHAELKHLGHGVSNITTAFTNLLQQKMALQIQKSGKSQQARKLYKLTRRGLLQVESLINKARMEE